MQRLSPRFRSQQFFLWKICGETVSPKFIEILEGIENKQRLQTLSIDNAWSNKNFLFYLTFRMLQHTSSEVNGYNCYKHFKKYKNKEGNW